MADQQIIDINSLPYAEKVELSDIIYVAKARENGYQLEPVQLSDLNAYFVNEEIYTRVKAKAEELKKLKSEFIDFIKTNYPTQDYVSENYSTEQYFRSVYSEINSVDSILSDIMVDYVSQKENSFLKNRAMKEVDSELNEYGSTIRSDLVERIDDSWSSSSD